MHRIITMRTHPRQTDGHHGNSMTIHCSNKSCAKMEGSLWLFKRIAFELPALEQSYMTNGVDCQ